MVRPVAGNLPEQVKNNQSVNTAAGNGGQKMSQYSWFTVYEHLEAGLEQICKACGTKLRRVKRLPGIVEFLEEMKGGIL